MPDKWEDTQGFQKFKKDYYNDYFKNTKEIMNGNPFTFFEHEGKIHVSEWIHK